MNWSCPDHGPNKVKDGRYGPYCATKLEDGSWCRQKPPRGSGGKGGPSGAVSQQPSEGASAIRELADAVRLLAGVISERFPKEVGPEF